MNKLSSLTIASLMVTALHAASASEGTPAVRRTIFDVRDFGAAGDAATLNTAAILCVNVEQLEIAGAKLGTAFSGASVIRLRQVMQIRERR